MEIYLALSFFEELKKTDSVASKKLVIYTHHDYITSIITDTFRF